jgi:hypothetical protein
MLEPFRRMWLGWNAAVRRFMGAQNAALMGLAWILGIAPVAVVLKLAGRDLLDRGPGEPGAKSYWRPRERRTMTMQDATRQF